MKQLLILEDGEVIKKLELTDELEYLIESYCKRQQEKKQYGKNFI